MTEASVIANPPESELSASQPVDVIDPIHEELHTLWNKPNGDNSQPVQQQSPPETYGFPFFSEFQQDPVDKCKPRMPTNTPDEHAREAACRLAYSLVIPPSPATPIL